MLTWGDSELWQVVVNECQGYTHVYYCSYVLVFMSMSLTCRVFQKLMLEISFWPL